MQRYALDALLLCIWRRVRNRGARALRQCPPQTPPLASAPVDRVVPVHYVPFIFELFQHCHNRGSCLDGTGKASLALGTGFEQYSIGSLRTCHEFSGRELRRVTLQLLLKLVHVHLRKVERCAWRHANTNRRWARRGLEPCSHLLPCRVLKEPVERIHH